MEIKCKHSTGTQVSFQNIKTKNTYNPKPWLTTGIRITCANKSELYVTYRKSNNPIHKEYYKSYCQIMSKVIMSTKNSTIIIL
jgi:hypothetical protein